MVQEKEVVPVVMHKKGASFVDIKGQLREFYASLRIALSLELYGPVEFVSALTIQ